MKLNTEKKINPIARINKYIVCKFVVIGDHSAIMNEFHNKMSSAVYTINWRLFIKL
jgi:hypothetical protein